MNARLVQFAALLVLTGCGNSAPTAAQQQYAGSASPANLRPTAPPFATTEVASFDDPWAMAFMPGTTTAIVTEKAGRLWLVDVSNGRKTAVTSAPAVAAGGQGGLLDVVLAPDFSKSRAVYLTYSEPSPNGGSGLALARGQLVQSAGSARLANTQVLWRDPAGGDGGQFGAIVAFAPDG